jgi:5'-nucleotidase
MKNDPSLHILLTNDDGHDAPGIQTMHRVLESSGYRVSMVAPSQEQSATSMSTTTRRNIPLEEMGGNRWHLDAQPADTVLVALRHLLQDDPPDLVLSGINFGPNLGIGLHASGTIGAAVMALLNGYPAIAVSAGMLFEEARESPPVFPSTHEVLEPAAEFTCRVIESLRESAESDRELMPHGLLLNINYPPLPAERIRGVLYPEVSMGHLIELGYYRCDETGHVVPRYHANVDPQRPDREEGDVRAHLEGYITVSPVRPSWNPPSEEAEALRERLNGVAQPEPAVKPDSGGSKAV